MAKINIEKVAPEKINDAIELGKKQVNDAINIVKEIGIKKKGNILSIIDATKQELSMLEQIQRSVEDIHSIKESKHKEVCTSPAPRLAQGLAWQDVRPARGIQEN